MSAAVMITVFLMMTVVGLDLTPADFRRLLERSRVPIVATLGQWILLPLVAWALAWLLPLPAHLFAGMILLAASPAGGISNYYCYLARADVALSVSLTAISILTSAFTMPLLAAAGFRLFMTSDSRVSAPVGSIVIQLVVLIVLPVILGMALRHRFPALTERHSLKVRRASAVLLLATVCWLVIGLRHTIAEDLGTAALATVFLTILATAAGCCVGLGVGANRKQLATLMIEFPCRNTAIPIMVGISVLDLPRLTVFALVFLLVQMALILSAITIKEAAARFRASSSAPARCSD